MKEIKEDQVEQALKKIKENNWITALKQCQSIKERYEKLMDLLPETITWDIISSRKLVLHLHRQFCLDFGICPLYVIEGDRQYCVVAGERIECLCVVPEDDCVFRDQDDKPKYPELLR